MPVRRSLWVALAYLVAGSLWIVFSDAVVLRLFDDSRTLSQVQVWKGWAFVAVTALVLYLVMVRQLRRDRELLRLQQEQQEEILRLTQFQQSAIENANIWICVLDSQGRVLLWNKAAEQICGYTSDEVMGSDRIWQSLFPDPEYRQWVFGKVGRILLGREEVDGFETWVQSREGPRRLMSWNSRAVRDTMGRIAGSVAIGRDITQREAAERNLRVHERQLATIMDNLPGMAYRCLYDGLWTMKFISSGCKDLTGYNAEDLTDNHTIAWADLILPADREQVFSQVEQSIGAAEPFALEYRLRRADGEVIWVWERGRGVEEDDELVLEGIMLDVTERKELEEQLAEMAAVDSLTGQFNRRETERVLYEEVVRAERYQRQLAVLWIDLDHFKQVNDTHGHAVGDQVLRTVSLRLADSIRSVDTLGRYGGEEFIVILPEMPVDKAMDTAERLRHRIAGEPITTSADGALSLSISIGIAVFPDHGITAEELCDAADRAMYVAKEQGRNRVAIAGPGTS